MSNKKLIITGKHNVDNLLFCKKPHIKTNAIENDIIHEEALSLLFCLNEDLDESLNKKAWREIEDKINGYKNQDLKKNIHNPESLITTMEVKTKLLDSFLHCCYCDNRVKFLSRVVRDPEQWTLDRIDNDKNHSDENTVISCLKCNLKRRCIKKEHFEFSQNLNIVKLDKKL